MTFYDKDVTQKTDNVASNESYIKFYSNNDL